MVMTEERSSTDETPVVLMPPRDVHNVTGAQVFLSCEVKAVPTPVITWKKINPLRKEDEGVYHCHAANAIGEAQSHSTVTVLDLSRYKSLHSPGPADLL
ncbi:Insulin-like growth factor-binding protein-like 1 [Cricetulus griseus]|uniref:Insulin-like growth factor-binding protein-like 1 n=1 Tax=Cricetulus griseus TaxID=10029 RepID=G3H7E7_CRIGR|nr:Insulin-like growth factor-binding protein-like 1 [Cricetulus griseus]